MLCYICGRICDLDKSGLCVECQRELAQNNEHVMILSLLNEAQEFYPVYLREKIEKVLFSVQAARGNVAYLHSGATS
jgi:hypothetical protein